MNIKKEKISENSELMQEWHSMENEKEGIFPENYSSGSNKKVHWKCKICGREWEQAVKKKAKSSGCPKCRARERRMKLIKRCVNRGVNDLATVRPDIADQWLAQDDGLKPTDVTVNSNVLVLWRCNNCDHEWQTTVYSRTSGSNCPRCGNSFNREVNTLVSRFPDIAKEWNYERNEISLHSIPAYSNRKVWWKCSLCGYEWPAIVENRTRNGTGCPDCARQTRKNKRGNSIKFKYI